MLIQRSVPHPLSAKTPIGGIITEQIILQISHSGMVSKSRDDDELKTFTNYSPFICAKTILIMCTTNSTTPKIYIMADNDKDDLSISKNTVALM